MTQLTSPMPPPWLIYPHISRFSIGWRMGYGEDYIDEFRQWFADLQESEQILYAEMFPPPKIWHGYYEKGYKPFESGELYYLGVAFWNVKGAYQYSREKLIAELTKSDKSLTRDNFVFFWKPQENAVNASCLGQWQQSKFAADHYHFSCAEQYMMAEKACLFEDEEIKEQILQATDPQTMKRLGKKVRNFDESVWNKAKYSIVLNGNYYKFSQNAAMREFLLSTENKILVEASPFDKIWGIGLAEMDKNAVNPLLWRGQNLLGFALMEVRDDLRKIFRNYEKIDWGKISEKFEVFP